MEILVKTRATRLGTRMRSKTGTDPRQEPKDRDQDKMVGHVALWSQESQQEVLLGILCIRSSRSMGNFCDRRETLLTLCSIATHTTRTDNPIQTSTYARKRKRMVIVAGFHACLEPKSSNRGRRERTRTTVLCEFCPSITTTCQVSVATPWAPDVHLPRQS